MLKEKGIGKSGMTEAISSSGVLLSILIYYNALIIIILICIFQNKTTGIMSEAAFLAPDFKIPVYLVSNVGDGPMIFDDYDDSSPPPESRFIIPESCKKAPLPTGPFPFSSSLDSSETLKMLRTHTR